jgi:hypothetical protein
VYGIPATVAAARPGGNCIHQRKQGEIMELVGLLFFVLIALLAAFGLTADSRDSADWKPTVDGFRAGRTY